MLRIAASPLQLREWYITDSVLHSLESFYHQQLRKVIGVHYPATISNDKLYDSTETHLLLFHLRRRR